jgi:hypothetical protein
VYVFRFARGQPAGRVAGSSDFVYVGSGRIQARLRSHSDADWENWEGSGWLICLAASGRGLDVAWKEFSEESARAAEAEILQQYLVDHRELPPANRQMPEIASFTGAMIALLSLDGDVRQAVISRVQAQQKTIFPNPCDKQEER